MPTKLFIGQSKDGLETTTNYFNKDIPNDTSVSERYDGSIPDNLKQQENMYWNEYKRALEDTGSYFFGKHSSKYRNARDIAYANYQNFINQMMANEYTTTMSSMQRAGLNPNLAYGTGSTASGFEAGHNNTPEQDGTGFFNAASALVGLGQFGIASKTAEYENMFKKVQTLLGIKEYGIKGLNDYNSQLKTARDEGLLSDEDYKRLRNDSTNLMIRQQEAATRTQEYQVDIAANTVKQTEQNLRKGEEEISNLAKEGKLKDQQISLAKEQVKIIENTVAQIPLQNQILAYEAITKQYGAKAAELNNGILTLNYANILSERNYKLNREWNPDFQHFQKKEYSTLLDANTSKNWADTAQDKFREDYYNRYGSKSDVMILGDVLNLIRPFLGIK